MRERASEAYQLLLTGREACSAFAHCRLEAVGQRIEVILQVYPLSSALHFRVRDIGGAESNIFGDGSGKQVRILEHNTENAPQLLHVVFANVDSTQSNGPLLHIVEP